MCYSANASFGSAALLIAMGAVATLKNKSKSYRMLAAVPFFFGAQQASEGIVWLTMGSNSSSNLHQFGIFGFLGFALIVWPSWVPWTILSLETDLKRKQILRILGIIGLCASSIALWILYTTDIEASIFKHSLVYSVSNLQRYWSPNFEFFIYFISTVLPFYISSLQKVRNTGYLVVTSMILTQIINKEASASVWCFFAALISIYLTAHINKAVACP